MRENFLQNLPSEHGNYHCFESDPYQEYSHNSEKSYKIDWKNFINYPAWQDDLLAYKNVFGHSQFLSLYFNQVCKILRLFSFLFYFKKSIKNESGS
jgi:hypothetical protein